MDQETNIPPHIQAVVKQLDSQIAESQDIIKTHQKIIKNLEFVKDQWLKQRPLLIRLTKKNSPLTRDLIRNFLQGYRMPVQTVKIISLLYDYKDQDKIDKLVKTLSVILNQMVKSGEVIMERKPGVKGNFYSWRIT